MKLVLLSGGSGKRLWPMSNDSRSKQFLRVLPDNEGNRESMLQRVWRQLGKVNLQHSAFICASKAQREIIESQIGFTPFIEEPERRDTFPAIALATTFLSEVEGVPDNECVAVLPIDHYVDDEYFQTVVKLESLLANHPDNELALMGVTPTEPTNKFGYIRIDAAHNADWFQVQSFVEKPDVEKAAELISEGALWNCGVFCFRVGYIKSVLEQKGLPTSYRELLAQFRDLPKRSFDYEVVEKAKSIVVLPYSGAWNDLGTWGALSSEFVTDFVGLGTTKECSGTHVINELGIPLIAMGLNKVVVVATPDGILVSDKEHATNLKNVVNEFDGRPMYEERRWGTYRVLDFQKMNDGTEVLTKFIELKPGYNISYQKHAKRSEVWTIIEGHGEMALDTRIVKVSPGDVIRVYPEQWHAIRALDVLKFIEVQRGSELIEEDIVRRFVRWEEVVEFCSARMI